MKNEKVIIVSRAGRPSIKALFPQVKNCTVAEKVELLSGKELIRVHKDGKAFNKYKSFLQKDFSISNSIIIRWGNRVQLNTNNCIVYNKSEAVAKASNKRLTREILNENGISIPKLVTPENFEKSDLPIIGRPSFHSKCKNLRKFDTEEDFVNHYKNNKHKGWYYSKFINKEKEFRIHCAHGKVLSISEKPKPKNQTEKNIIIGWGYSVVEEEWRVLHWNEYKASWCKLALNAVKILGLDFGAVDIIVKDKKAYVLEVNTAGSLSESPYLQKRYSMYFNWLFSSNERREHWDFEKFEAGASLAWKNNQLK